MPLDVAFILEHDTDLQGTECQCCDCGVVFANVAAFNAHRVPTTKRKPRPGDAPPTECGYPASFDYRFRLTRRWTWQLAWTF